MPTIQILKPTDQPTGQKRLLQELRAALDDPRFNRAYLSVAFARKGPLLKLRAAIQDFRNRGGQIEAIFGTDLRGTTVEALTEAMAQFDRVAVVHSPGRFQATFHPKVYVFVGADRARFIVGSNNVTPGGLETNYETAVLIEVDRVEEADLFEQLMDLWRDADRMAIVVDGDRLEGLQQAGLLGTEKDRQAQGGQGRVREGRRAFEIEFPEIDVVPPEPLPPAERSRRRPQEAAEEPTRLGAHGLVIEVIPHHNGEVFLSYSAVRQDPQFFGFPFSGQTVPKIAGNAPYPQREPDPVVDVYVYDDQDAVVESLVDYGLNTVDYEERHEIRITISSPVAREIPERSILVMQESNEDRIDFRLDFYPPGSPEHQRLLGILRTSGQAMPSGGRPNPRRFAWL